MERYDVVVVGARCAGSPLAAMLARRGLRVCVLDRARFPSDSPSTHVVQPCGVAVLRRLGVLEAVLAAGAVPLGLFTLVNEDVRIDARVPDPGLCVRRVTLDALLLQAASTAGAEVRTGTAVTGLLSGGGRVVGVQSRHGPVRARLVVGADGHHSAVARLTGAEEYHVAPAGRLPTWAYFQGVADTEGRLRIGRLGDLAFLASPTDGGLYLAGIAPDAAGKDAFLADRERAFTAGLAGWPELADLLAGATRVGPIRTVPDWYGYFRVATGPGWVLTGDAGHAKDPTPAQGISDALRHAERLTVAIHDGLNDTTAALDTTLRRWWRWRDEDCYPMHCFATDMGAPGRSTPLITQVLRDIAADDTATAKLLQVLNREIQPTQLFTATRLALAAARTLRRRPRHLPALTAEITTALRQELRRATARRHSPASYRAGQPK
jgi:flavin-dependent dehydrogenase